MKLFIVGATGPTGLCLITEALSRDHEVTALVRNPDKISITNEKLKVVKGSILNVSDLTENMRGCDAVLSAIGGPGGFFTSCDIYTTSGQAIVKAMQETGVTKLVTCSAWGTKDDAGLPFLWRWIFKPTYLRNVLNNMAEFEDFLAEQSGDFIYIIVKPPVLTNEASKGERIVAVEGQCVTGQPSYRISRADVAKFMLDCLHTDQYNCKLVAINIDHGQK